MPNKTNTDRVIDHLLSAIYHLNAAHRFIAFEPASEIDFSHVKPLLDSAKIVCQQACQAYNDSTQPPLSVFDTEDETLYPEDPRETDNHV